MRLRRFSQAFEKAGLRAQGALQGLDNDGGQFRPMRLDELDRSFGFVKRTHQHGLRCLSGYAAAVGGRGGIVGRPAGCGALHGVIMSTVPTPFELEDLLPAGEGARQAQRSEGALGARRGVAQGLAAGRGFDHPLRQADGGLVEPVEGRAERRLLGDGGGDGGMGMAQNQRAGAEDVVDILFARHVVDSATLAAMEYRSDFIG